MAEEREKPGREASRAVVDGYPRLAVAIVLQAARDLRAGEPLKKLDALLWLGLSDQAALYCEANGLPSPIKLLTRPGASARLQRLDKRKHKGELEAQYER